MGGSHVRDGEVKKENVVALCDIDDRSLYAAAEVHPMAEQYNDFRVMFDKQQKDIDAVICATPDHCHAVVTAAGSAAGQARVYPEAADPHRLRGPRHLRAGQGEPQARDPDGQPGPLERRGAAGSSRSFARERSARSRRSTPGPTGRSGRSRSTGRRTRPPCPHHVHWDLWLGPMPERPYNPAYHPFAWRGWWDFGTGALGDMACHICDTAFWALDLRHPTSIEAKPEGLKPETGPKTNIITYEFPARGDQPPVTLNWYDGNLTPAE